MFRTIILQLKINLKKEWVIKRPTELEGLTYEERLKGVNAYNLTNTQRKKNMAMEINSNHFENTDISIMR